jgi:hypothetical protein
MSPGFAPGQLKYAAKVTLETMIMFNDKMIDDKFTLNVHEAMTMIGLDLMLYICNCRGKVAFGCDFEAVKQWAMKQPNYDRETVELFAALASKVLHYFLK